MNRKRREGDQEGIRKLSSKRTKIKKRSKNEKSLGLKRHVLNDERADGEGKK